MAILSKVSRLVAIAEQGNAASKLVYQQTARNMVSLYPGIDTKSVVRKMKRGENVWVIDSIYRNKM
jgi:hypothetical protein